MIPALIPCKHATDYEIARGAHLTREDDGICNPCASLISLFEMKRADAAADEAREIARAHHPSNRKMAEED